MANRSHAPTAETRAQVEALASFGTHQEDIAKFLGISHPTLRRHYREELKVSAIKANATVGKYLFNLASGRAIKDGATHSDCRSAAIFWAKTRMGWTEKMDLSNSDGSLGPTVIKIVAAKK
jgi:hypothetical protein